MVAGRERAANILLLGDTCNVREAPPASLLLLSSNCLRARLPGVTAKFETKSSIIPPADDTVS